MFQGSQNQAERSSSDKAPFTNNEHVLQIQSKVGEDWVTEQRENGKDHQADQSHPSHGPS
jgi:hypothetical protein